MELGRYLRLERHAEVRLTANSTLYNLCILYGVCGIVGRGIFLTSALVCHTILVIEQL